MTNYKSKVGMTLVQAKQRGLRLYGKLPVAGHGYCVQESKDGKIILYRFQGDYRLSYLPQAEVKK